MTAPTLPGTLPGLLQPGAPVVWNAAHGWVVAPINGIAKAPEWCVEVVLTGVSITLTIPLSRLALDLSRPEGVDRALRWLAGRLGLAASALPPLLTRIDTGISVDGEALVWCLAPVDGKPRHVNTVIGYFDNTADPIEALRLACLAAGEGA